MLSRLLIAFSAILAINGCTTPEQRATRAACAAEWISRIPPEYESRIVVRHRMEDVFDGTETCVTETVLDTSDSRNPRYITTEKCTPNVQRIKVPYEAEETFDLHSRERNVHIRDCIAERCMASHGNVSCN